MGLFTLMLFAYLAATYLLFETTDQRLQDLFRGRAIVAVLAVGDPRRSRFSFLAKMGHLDCGENWQAAPGEFRSNSELVFLTIAAVWCLVVRRYRWARACAVLQVTLTLWAWGIAQYPYLVPPYLTIFNAAAPEVTLRYILLALCLGGLVLFPALFYLFPSL